MWKQGGNESGKEPNLRISFKQGGEENDLFEVCIKYGIPITYPQLFNKDEPHHYMWVFNKNGIGLIGTIIMLNLSKNKGKIFHGINEVKEFFKK